MPPVPFFSLSSPTTLVYRKHRSSNSRGCLTCGSSVASGTRRPGTCRLRLSPAEYKCCINHGRFETLIPGITLAPFTTVRLFDVPTAASSKEEGNGAGGFQLPPAAEDHDSHWSESGSRMRNAPQRFAGDVPGESALREQRKRREDRCRERVIDTALEKVHGWLAGPMLRLGALRTPGTCSGTNYLKLERRYLAVVNGLVR